MMMDEKMMDEKVKLIDQILHDRTEHYFNVIKNTVNNDRNRVSLECLAMIRAGMIGFYILKNKEDVREFTDIVINDLDDEYGDLKKTR